MPSISDMFPSLDFDTLNRGLNFINFSLPNSGIATAPNLGMDPGFQGDRFKDGIQNQSPNMTVEVTDQELPKNEKDWDKLSMSERIDLVKSEALGMPIISQIDLSGLRKVATGMDKKGMYKESVRLFKIAENFNKSLTMNESETDGKHDENATVTLNVDKDGQPISITKNFQSIEEALEFYDQFILPGVEEVMALEGSMSHFGFDKEAMALRRFVRAVKMQIPEKKAQVNDFEKKMFELMSKYKGGKVSIEGIDPEIVQDVARKMDDAGYATYVSSGNLAFERKSLQD